MTVMTPADARRCPPASCAPTSTAATLPRWSAALREAGIVASVTPYAERLPRFGPSIVTDPDEVDALVAAVADLP